MPLALQRARTLDLAKEGVNLNFRNRKGVDFNIATYWKFAKQMVELKMNGWRVYMTRSDMSWCQTAFIFLPVRKHNPKPLGDNDDKEHLPSGPGETARDKTTVQKAIPVGDCHRILAENLMSYSNDLGGAKLFEPQVYVWYTNHGLDQSNA